MEKKREILEEQIKQALTSTFKVISNHIEDKNSKNKDLKTKTLDFTEIKDYHHFQKFHADLDYWERQLRESHE